MALPMILQTDKQIGFHWADETGRPSTYGEIRPQTSPPRPRMTHTSVSSPSLRLSRRGTDWARIDDDTNETRLDQLSGDVAGASGPQCVLGRLSPCWLTAPMCLGIPGRIVEVVEGFADRLALVDVEGAQRKINIGMLEQEPAVGDWILIHMGFALELIDEAAISGLEMMGRAREDSEPEVRHA